MSIERKAARGVAWNLATGVGTRVVGLVGTLVLTRFISPAEYGEVSAAAICVFSANQLTFLAVGPYIIAHKSTPEVAYQAAKLQFLLATVAVAVALLLRGPLGVMLDAPAMGRFMAGYAAAAMLDAAKLVPGAVLVRDLRFRTVAIVNSVGELTFTATALALVARWGAYAIMAGAFARSFVTFALYVANAPRAEWLAPTPFQKDVLRRIFGFGSPVLVSSMADRAASTWDNLIFLRLFGAQIMGGYALSYSLAETPLIYVAERMSDVLLPTFSKMEPAERPPAVIRAAGLMALVVAPLGVGLGSVAPSIVRVFFDTRWAGMAPILMVLSVMTVFQPIPWSAMAYLQAQKMTRPAMAMAIARAIVLLSLVALLGYLGGPTWACAGVGVGYSVHSVLTVLVTARYLPLDVGKYFANVARPLLACAPMFFAVTGIRYGLAQVHVPDAISLAVQVVGGGLVYVASAVVIANSNVREILRLVRQRPEREAPSRAPSEA